MNYIPLLLFIVKYNTRPENWTLKNLQLKKYHLSQAKKGIASAQKFSSTYPDFQNPTFSR